MAVSSAAASDTGRKRDHNEDSFRIDGKTGLYLVADGMGGQVAGEIASCTAADAVQQFITDTEHDWEKTWPYPLDPSLSYHANRLKAAIAVANRSLARQIEDDGALKGMATTIAAALVRRHRLIVSNLGDCRVYLIRSGSLKQLTTDHSWIGEQLRAGVISAAEARTHPWRNMVTRALAGSEEVDPDTKELDAEEGDRLLLCSDGLHGVVGDEEILELVLRHDDDLDAACRGLVEAANTNGGPDNVTVVLVQIGKEAVSSR